MTKGEENIVQSIDKENYELRQKLAEAKRLLKQAVEDFSKLVELVEYSDDRGIGCVITDEGHHDECPLNDGYTFGWRYADEVKKLFKEG